MVSSPALIMLYYNVFKFLIFMPPQSPAANGKRLFSYFSSASFAVFKNPNTLSIALWQAVN